MTKNPQYETGAQSEINYRVDFAHLCNARNVRTAVEVGTDLGIFARQFMQNFQGERLLCIDPYEPFEESAWSREPDMIMAVQALAPWHGRVRFIKQHSPDVVCNLPPWLYQRIDFVYIDASHEYENVKTDLQAWWNILLDRETPAILAGHDFDETHPGVMRAVNEFAHANSLTMRIVAGDDEPSYYFYTQEPEKLYMRYWDNREVSLDDFPFGANDSYHRTG